MPRNLSGCLVCRIRKKKCDEDRPQCRNCMRLNIECLGSYGERIPREFRGEVLQAIKQHTRRLANRNGPPLRLVDLVTPTGVVKNVGGRVRTLPGDDCAPSPIDAVPLPAACSTADPGAPPGLTMSSSSPQNPDRPLRASYHADLWTPSIDILPSYEDPDGSGKLPSSFWLKDVEVHRENYIARGGEACIYRGTLGNRKVVAREVSTPGSAGWRSREGQHVIELVKREILVHAQIQHQNIIPLLGIWGDSGDGPPLMIMPFAENGAALAYLQGDNCDTSDCAKILTGSALGLSHLHSRSPVVVHGDVKPGNILVDRGGNALVCDFGLSRIRHEVTRTHTKIREGGHPRFLAPELLDDPREFLTTTPSDVYSLALTFLNLVTLETPFSQYTRDFAAASAAQRGERPHKPDNPRFFTLDVLHSLWGLFEDMWARDPFARPDAECVADRLQTILKPLDSGNVQ